MRQGLEYLAQTFGVRPNSIIHVGAHEGQERQEYYDIGASRVIFIEAIPSVYSRLRDNIAQFPGYEAVCAVCSERDGDTVQFNLTSNEESSSILDLGYHKELYPDIVLAHKISMKTRSLDSLIEERYGEEKFKVLILDVQGAELKVLKGSSRIIDNCDAVYTEVSEIPLYTDSCTLIDLINFFEPRGFGLKWLNLNGNYFGDCIFVRNNRTLHSAKDVIVRGHNLALGKPASQSSLSRFNSEEGAGGGNNGLRTGKFGFHTEFDLNPWWQVELGTAAPIREVVIFNRIDVAAERARTLQVFGRFEGGDWRLFHDQNGRLFGGIDGYPLRVDMRGERLTSVRLELKGWQYFHLDEVEIYTDYPPKPT